MLDARTGRIVPLAAASTRQAALAATEIGARPAIQGASPGRGPGRPGAAVPGRTRSPVRDGTLGVWPPQTPDRIEQMNLTGKVTAESSQPSLPDGSTASGQLAGRYTSVMAGR
jgi:hypothetical protein